MDRNPLNRASGRNAAQFIDTQYADFIEDPLSVVGRVYAQFGLNLSDRAIRAMTAFSAANQQGKHGRLTVDQQLRSMPVIQKVSA